VIVTVSVIVEIKEPTIGLTFTVKPKLIGQALVIENRTALVELVKLFIQHQP
jgi:hypothetical protein